MPSLDGVQQRAVETALSESRDRASALPAMSAIPCGRLAPAPGQVCGLTCPGLTVYQVIVPGRPVPKKVTTYKAKWADPRAQESLAYQDMVAWTARAARIPLLAGPAGLTLRVFVKDDRRGDLKNYTAAIEDGLVFGGCLENDRQILRYGPGSGIYYDTTERAEIELWPLPCVGPAKPAERGLSWLTMS